MEELIPCMCQVLKLMNCLVGWLLRVFFGGGGAVDRASCSPGLP